MSTSATGSVVLSLSSVTISASTPGTVTAQVRDASGNPLENKLVKFSVSESNIATVSLSAVTDKFGNASATLQPVAGALGAAYVSAAADVSNGVTLETKTVFSVSAVDVALASVSASPTAVSAYGSSVVTVNVKGASSSSPVTVNFSSTCASAGKAFFRLLQSLLLVPRPRPPTKTMHALVRTASVFPSRAPVSVSRSIWL